MKNDDMDDMMRKAADEYELNHDMASDWNKVQAGIQQQEPSLQVQAKQEKRRRYLLWLWFLIIPALLITMYKMNLFVISSNNQNKAAEVKMQKKLPGKLNSLKQHTNNSKTIYSKDLTLKQPTVIPKDHSIPALANKNISAKKFSLSYNISKEKNIPLKKSFSNIELIKNLNNQNNNNSNQQTLLTANTVKKNTTDTVFVMQHQTVNNNSIPQPKYITKDSAAIQQSKQKNKTSYYTKQAFAYAGILANADISFIKDQKTSSPAFGAGFIGGYHFKNGISIESGLLYDKKNYYTKGKYFNTDKLSYLQSVNLLATNGNCYMYEIPINLKYDFTSHKKFNWFITAGTSSYLMHKEFYNFKYDDNGIYGERSYSYYHTSKNWFAILNLGAGVNIQTSNKYFLQVQPYFKAPINGIGIGNLQLSSTGINISLGRRIP